MKLWVIKCDYERYTSIAERYPRTLFTDGTKEQAEKLTYALGWIEPGCNDLFTFEGESEEVSL
jgi:hypothetical protein